MQGDSRMKNSHGFRLVLFFLVCILFFAVSCSGMPLTGTLTPITDANSSVSHYEPAINGDYLVWRDDRTGDSNVYLYDISTGIERQLSTTPWYEMQPVISGHYVAWQDDRYSDSNNYDIVLYDLDTGMSTRIANETGEQANPAIDGNIVVWQDYRNEADYEIYLYSISDKTETQVSSAGGDQLFPRVSDNIVVWEDASSSQVIVTMYDFAGNQTPFQPVSFGAGEEQSRPVVKNNFLAWSDNHEFPSYPHIYRKDLATGGIEDITPDDHEHTNPDIDGTRVVWTELGDIYLNDTAVPGSKTRITVTGEENPIENIRISGDRIVWRETDGSTGIDTIYLFTIGSKEECPDADFAIQPSQSGPVPFMVTFTDTSTDPPGNPIAHWTWDFGDGFTSTEQNPVHEYTGPGTYDVRLTVDNPLCRNITEIDPGYRITAGAAPVAGIIASTTSGMVPLTVTFTDTSAAADAWNWSFGDGTYAETNPATHTYTSGGTYTARLVDANEYGTSVATKTIHALTGANENACTGIDGISLDNRFGGQFLVFDGTVLPGYELSDEFTLISPPLPGSGWQNITFLSEDDTGFYDHGNGTVTGNLTGVIFQGSVIQPAGFSDSVGSQSSINYALNLARYPEDGTINTQVWEGVLPSDLEKFRLIGHGGGWSHVLEIAYTIKFTKTHVSPAYPATIYFSVSSSWVRKFWASADEGRDHTFLMRIGDDGKGEVLHTWYLYSDATTNLDYFEADSPRGLSTFGVSNLAGSGNLFQLIDLSVAQRIGEDSSSDSGDSPAPAAPEIPAPPSGPQQPAPPQPEMPPTPPVTADLYFNSRGVITQATALRSADGRAIITVNTGIIALDNTGNPLPEISMQPALSSEITGEFPDATFQYAGHGYHLGPDGATFSPAITLTFFIPDLGWNSEYVIREYDAATRTWTDLPTTLHPESGTITAEVSHFCCIALFSRPVQPAAATVAPSGIQQTPAMTAVVTTPPPPGSAMGIFTNMVFWLITILRENILVIAVAVIALAIAWFITKKRRMDKIRYG